MIEQLWFGWSEVGLEGSNLQQIIAASPGLSDPRSPTTQKALKFCYSPARPTTGWCQADGVRVIFRRTPLGLDGRGRPGKYFVHVLAGDDLRPAQIDSIINSQLLLSQAPETAGTMLEQVPSPDTASLATLSPPEAGIEAVGHYLANLAAGRLTALRATSERAVQLASFVARLLPDSLGLVGFSESETASDSAQYDITLAPAPTPLFAEIDPASSAPDGWREAAQLLLDADAGDQYARDCIGVLAGSAATRRDFSIALSHWCAIERGTLDAVTMDALSWLDQEPALRRRALRSAALSTIVELALQGRQPAALVLEHDLDSNGSLVLDAVCLAAQDRLAIAVDRLASAGATALSRAIISRMSPFEIDLAPLQPNRQRALLDLFRSDGQRSPAVERLLDNLSLAVSIVGDPRVPVGWQIFAIRKHAARLQASAIGQFLARWPDLTDQLCASPVSASVLDQIGTAMDGLDVPLALRIRDNAAECIPDEVDREWWMACYQRLNPRQRLDLLGRAGRQSRYVSPSATAKACAAAIAWCCERSESLPPVDLLLQVLSRRGHSDDSVALYRFCLAIGNAGRRYLVLDPMVERIARTVDPYQRSAMTELLVWRLLETEEADDFWRGIRRVARLEEAVDIAPRLWRAADAMVHQHPLVAVHLISWTAAVLDQDKSSDVVRTMQPERVRQLLERSNCQQLAAHERTRAHGKAAQRWLDKVLPPKHRFSLLR